MGGWWLINLNIKYLVHKNFIKIYMINASIWSLFMFQWHIMTWFHFKILQDVDRECLKQLNVCLIIFWISILFCSSLISFHGHSYRDFLHRNRIICSDINIHIILTMKWLFLILIENHSVFHCKNIVFNTFVGSIFNDYFILRVFESLCIALAVEL